MNLLAFTNFEVGIGFTIFVLGCAAIMCVEAVVTRLRSMNDMLDAADEMYAAAFDALEAPWTFIGYDVPKPTPEAWGFDAVKQRWTEPPEAPPALFDIPWEDVGVLDPAPPRNHVFGGGHSEVYMAAVNTPPPHEQRRALALASDAYRRLRFDNDEG